MADVGPLGETPWTERLDRGQVIIVSGLLLAVVFVGLALVVNSAIYAENIATRDTGNENNEPLETYAWVNESIARTIDRVNANLSTTSFSTLNQSLGVAIQNQSSAIKSNAAKRGVVIDIERGQPQRGVRLRQTDPTRNFADKNGNANWDLTTEVTEPGQITLELEKSGLYSAGFDTTMAGLADSAFGLEFYLEDYGGSGDGVWRVYFFQGATTQNVYAIVERPNQTFTDLTDDGLLDHVIDGWLGQSCSTLGSSVTVHLEDERFGGANCDQFEFYDDIGNHTLAFTNAYTEGGLLSPDQDRGVGSYDILVKGGSQNPGVFHDPGDGQPFWQSSIYSQNVTITYRNDGTTYTAREHTIVPQRHRHGGVFWAYPRIDRFEVTQTSATSFEADWNVSHPNAKLDQVEVYLVDRATDVEVCILLCGLLGEITETINTNQTVASETISVSGAEAGGETTVSGGLGIKYTVKLVVRDEQGRTRVENRYF